MNRGRNQGPVFWASAAAGWALILWGIRGIFRYNVDTRPTQLARFLLGGVLLHDLVLVPVVLLVGLGVARAIRPPWRRAVQAAAVISACAVLYAYPLVRGYARALGNPTSLPHNYGRNLLVVVAAIWLIALAVAATVRLSSSPSRRGRTTRSPSAGS